MRSVPERRFGLVCSPYQPEASVFEREALAIMYWPDTPPRRYGWLRVGRVAWGARRGRDAPGYAWIAPGHGLVWLHPDPLRVFIPFGRAANQRARLDDAQSPKGGSEGS